MTVSSARPRAPVSVIPAKAGISGQEVSAGLHETPAFAGGDEEVAEGGDQFLEMVDDRVRAEGARLAVCTNKPEALTHLLLEALGWQDSFDAVVGGDTLPLRKPDPALLREAIARAGGGTAVLVGDSITDADTARAADVPFLAVSFGFSDRPVEALGADAIVDHFDELILALRDLS